MVIIPNVAPTIQRGLLAAVLDYIGDRDLVNRAIEINLTGDTTEIEEYEIPPQDAVNFHFSKATVQAILAAPVPEYVP